MTATGLQLTSVIGTTLCAGLLMVFAGTQKKMLQWKKSPRRCPVCGRVGRNNCACRR